MRDEYQKWISSDGAYSLPKHFRPYIAQMKDIFRNREQSNSFFDDSFDKVSATVFKRLLFTRTSIPNII